MGIDPIVVRTFTDIAASPFKSYIEWVYAQGITSGCSPTLYCPNDPVPRDQMASFLSRALHLSGAAPDAFTDDEENPHEPNINLVAREAIASGCGVNLFCPSALVKRDQMASFLSRALDLSGAAPNAFTDDNGNIHEVNINLVAREGIASGCTATTYCPIGQRRPGARWPPSCTAPSHRERLGRRRRPVPGRRRGARQAREVLLVVVDRESEQAGDVEASVGRVDAGPRPGVVVEHPQEVDRARAQAPEQAEDVDRATRRRTRAAGRAPCATNGARRRRRASARRASQTSPSTAIRWRTTSAGVHSPAGTGRPSAARAASARRPGNDAKRSSELGAIGRHARAASVRHAAGTASLSRNPCRHRSVTSTALNVYRCRSTIRWPDRR